MIIKFVKSCFFLCVFFSNISRVYVRGLYYQVFYFTPVTRIVLIQGWNLKLILINGKIRLNFHQASIKSLAPVDVKCNFI